MKAPLLADPQARRQCIQAYSQLPALAECTTQGRGGQGADQAGASQGPTVSPGRAGSSLNPDLVLFPLPSTPSYLCAHTSTHTRTHSHTRTQMRTCAYAHAGSAGVMRSPHLPARCTPAVNQCLEGAAGAATPREMRAAKGYVRFPEPLTVAAWNQPGACQPFSCPLPLPEGETGLRED